MSSKNEIYTIDQFIKDVEANEVVNSSQIATRSVRALVRHLSGVDLDKEGKEMSRYLTYRKNTAQGARSDSLMPSGITTEGILYLQELLSDDKQFALAKKKARILLRNFDEISREIIQIVLRQRSAQ